MKLIRLLTFPFSAIYYIVVWFRNVLFDLGLKPSKSYDFPIICVGNLSTGGTGKTPMIEYLIGLLKDDFKVATLSRGYKRMSKGFQIADKNASTKLLGDEPFQFYNKFGDDIVVSVDADRQNGILRLQNLDETPQVILLDDAYQHRRVKAGFNILLTTYKNPYFKDFVLPVGNLRESRSGASRANVIIVTKSPKALSESEKQYFISGIKPQKHQSVFFSYIDYSKTVYSSSSTKKLEHLSSPFTLVTGIANPKPLVDFLKDNGLDFEHLNYKDHYNFTPQDISKLGKKELILTTEKDYMRLMQYKSLKDKLFYLPIKVVIDKPLEFDKLIKNYVIS